MAKKDKSEYIIQAVDHALDLLEQFQGDVDELGVTENYRLGLKTLELGQTFIKQMGLLRQSRPVLESLVRECNETTYVAILKESHIVYLDVVETDLTVRVVPRVGSRLPAYCTAAGKVQLAYMTEEELDNYLPTK